MVTDYMLWLMLGAAAVTTGNLVSTAVTQWRGRRKWRELEAEGRGQGVRQATQEGSQLMRTAKEWLESDDWDWEAHGAHDLICAIQADALEAAAKHIEATRRLLAEEVRKLKEAT